MAPGPSRRSPFPGLDAFDEADRRYFFGRRKDIELISANVFASRLTVLHGPSGVGKTSVLRAGVVPRLREREDHFVILVESWSRDPAQSILQALRAAAVAAGCPVTGEGTLVEALGECAARLGREPVLLLDQFEDSFQGDEDGDAFVEDLAAALTAPALRLRVLISLREESLAWLDRYDDLVPGLFDSLLRLDYLDRDGAEQAVYEPVEVWNGSVSDDERMTVEAALVDAVLASAQASRSTTGIDTAQLQLVFHRLWDVERSAGSLCLRAETLDRLGGVQGIVRDHVHQALGSLEPREEALAAVALDRLVTPSGTRIAQRGSDLAEYARVPEAELRPALTSLDHARVLRQVAADTAEGGRYEVSHESLADVVLQWLNERRLAEERERFRRRLMKFAGVAAVSSLLLAALLALVLYAASERSKRQSARSQAFGAAALGLLDSDPALGLALALAAVREAPSAPAESALRAALAASHERARLRHPAAVGSVSVSADGREVVTVDASGVVRLWSSPAGDLLRTLPLRPGVERAVMCGDPGQLVLAGRNGGWIASPGRGELPLRPSGVAIMALSCSPDGRRVAAAGIDGVTRVYDVATGRRIASLRLPIAASDVQFSADGTRMVVSWPAGATVWRVADRAELAHVGFAGEEVTKAALSPDGARVVVAAGDGSLSIWDVDPKRRIRVLRGNRDVIAAVAFSPDGALVAAAGSDRSARVWDAVTGEPVAVLHGHEDAVTSMAFAPGSRTIVTGDQDGTARLWELPVSHMARGPAVRATATAFSPDGSHVAIAGANRRVVVWDTVRGRRLADLSVGPAHDMSLSPDGARLVTLDSGTGIARLYATGEPGTPLALGDAADPVVSAAFHPGGRSLALGGEMGTVRLLDLDGRTTRELHVESAEPVRSLAFSPDGRRLAAGTFPTGQVTVFDVTTGARLLRMRNGHAGLHTLVFSADGAALVSAGGAQAAIWDSASGAPKVILRGPSGLVRTAGFSPDRRLAVTAGTDGVVRVWETGAGSPLLELRARDGRITPDGKSIVVVGALTTPRLLRCDPCGTLSQLEDRAEARVTRELTPALRAQYGG